MGHGARGGRVELLAVGESVPGGAQLADWDVGMFRWAGRGGRMAQPCPGRQRGQPVTAQSSNSSGSDWSNTKSGMGSTSVGLKARVWSSRKSPCGGPRAGEIGGGV